MSQVRPISAPESTDPTIELLARWRTGEFTQLYSDDMLLELVEKLRRAASRPKPRISIWPM